MKNRRYNVKNEAAYFNKVIKHMEAKELIKQSQIEKAEFSIEELTGVDVKDNFDLDKELADRNLLGWIDMIEDQKLLAAVKSLSLDEQVLLSYIFEKEKTQCELAETFKVSQPAINLKLKTLIKTIKEKIN